MYRLFYSYLSASTLDTGDACVGSMLLVSIIIRFFERSVGDIASECGVHFKYEGCDGATSSSSSSKVATAIVVQSIVNSSWPDLQDF